MASEIKKEKRYYSFTAWMLSAFFVISLAALALYVLDLDYEDSFLYFLLSILRYSSFLVFIFSLYNLLLDFYRLIRKRQGFNPIKMIIYLLLLIYGIALFLVEGLIITVSGGNL